MSDASPGRDGDDARSGRAPTRRPSRRQPATSSAVSSSSSRSSQRMTPAARERGLGRPVLAGERAGVGERGEPGPGRLRPTLTAMTGLPSSSARSARARKRSGRLKPSTNRMTAWVSGSSRQ